MFLFLKKILIIHLISCINGPHHGTLYKNQRRKLFIKKSTRKIIIKKNRMWRKIFMTRMLYLKDSKEDVRMLVFRLQSEARLEENRNFFRFQFMSHRRLLCHNSTSRNATERWDNIHIIISRVLLHLVGPGENFPFFFVFFLFWQWFWHWNKRKSEFFCMRPSNNSLIHT